MAQFSAIPSMQANPFSSYFEQFTKSPFQGMQGTHMEAIIELNSITTRLYSELARQNLKVMNELMQCSVKELQDLSQARGLPDVFNVLSQGAAEASPAVMEHAQWVMNALINTATEYNRIFTEGMAKTTKVVNKYAQEKTTEKRQA